MQYVAHLARVCCQLLVHHQVDGCKRRGATNRIAGVCGRHGADGLRIHDLRAACHRRQRERARNTLPEQSQVRQGAVVLEAPHGTGSAKTRLHFIKDQERFVLMAPLAKRTHIFVRREGGARALISFHQHGRNVLWIYVPFVEAALKIIERRIRSAEAIRKGDLHETWIQIADPFLQIRNPAGLLRA